MKYYKQNNEVFAYELDGSQDHLIGDKTPMTDEEAEAHINPPKTEAQILAEKVAEAHTYIASTDWVEPYILRHELGLSILPNDSNKLVIKAMRDEKIEFIRANNV